MIMTSYQRAFFAGMANPKFSLNYKPQPVDHKIWKNALEVSITQLYEVKLIISIILCK